MKKFLLALLLLALPAFAQVAGERVTGATVESEAVSGATVTAEPPTSTTFSAARFAGNTAGAVRAVTIGGTGAINFEVQGWVYLEGAHNSQARIFMVQFPASRQAGLFATNVNPFDIHTGDSQVGQVGGFIGANPAQGEWCFVTFSADGTVATSGLWRGSVECQDGSPAFTAGGRTKGVESSLTGNAVELNGGADEFGWTNGIRYAEVRAYNAQRTDVQRQADKNNTTDFSGALFWWRFSGNGGGGVTTTDMTGNGRTPTLTSATLATGPTL